MSFRMVKNIGHRSICDATVLLRDFPGPTYGSVRPVITKKEEFVPEIWEDVCGQGPNETVPAKRYRVTAFLGKDPEGTCDRVLRGLLDYGCRSASFVPVTSVSLIEYALNAFKKVPADKDLNAVFVIPNPRDACIATEYADELLESVLSLKRWQRRKKNRTECILSSAAECGVPAATCRAATLEYHHETELLPELESLLASRGESFSKKLFSLIYERGMTDVEVYKKANLDRKLFSKIRCREDYRPKKKTVLALGVALKLNMEELQDLLSRAELAMSPDSVSDLIVSYFIERGVWDIYTINSALYRYSQPLLGA